jgi:hypothetical protein
MNALSSRSGRCLCGKVTYTFVPAELEIDACHCTMCRRWGGGPGLSIMAKGAATVSGTEYVAVYKSSEWGERHFCRNCGTHLFFAAPANGYFGVSAGTVDHMDDFKFTTEIFIDFKPETYAFANETKKLTEAQFLDMIAALPAKE